MRLAWVGCVVVLGCGPVVATHDTQEGSASAEDTSTGTVSTTEPGTISTSVGPSTTTTATVTTSPVTSDIDTGCTIDCVDFPSSSCPAVPGWECAAPIECAPGQCGGPFSPFDENGCLRASCLGGECPPDQVCFTPDEWGVCSSSNVSCGPDPMGACVCASTDDCGGSWCIPVDEAPPAACNEIASTEACAESTCLVLEGRPIVQTGDACLCELPLFYCSWASDPPLALEPTVYWRWSDGAVVVFPELYDPPPLGWSFCSDANAPAACSCAEVLPCAM